MSKRSAFRKISEMQLYPLAFNLSKSPTSWVSLRNEDEQPPIANRHNVDYVVIQKPKSKLNLRSVTTYFNTQMLIWDILTVTSIVINIFLISLTYIFIKPKDILNNYLYGFIACDIICILDVILAFVVRYNANVRIYIIGESKSLALILLDLLLVIPIANAYLAVTKEPNSLMYLMLRFLTLLQMYRLPILVKRLENTVCSYRWILFGVKFFIYYLIIQHFCVCLWYLLLSLDSGETIDWTKTIENESYYPKNQKEWYVTSLYYTSTTFFNCGLGDIHPLRTMERYASGTIMYLGQLFWIFYISTIAVLFVRKKRRYFSIFRRSKLIAEQLEFIDATPSLLSKIKRYYNVFLAKKSGILSTDKLKYIPGDMVAHMNHLASYPWLRNSVVFKNKPEPILRHVSFIVKHEFYLTGQDIYTENKIKDKMVIIRSGTVNILSEEDHESPVLSFGPGTCLGECALMLCMPSKVTVRAASFVELQAIYTRDFIKCSLTHPDFFVDVRVSLQKRLFKSLSVDTTRGNILKTLKNVLNEKIQCPEMVMKFLPLYCIQKPEQKKVFFQKLNSAWIKNGNSFMVTIWDVFIVVCAVTVAIFHSYFAAFRRDYPDWYANVSTIIHVVFVLDLAVILTTCVEKRTGTINTLTGILSYQLDQVGFTLDVISSFYLEVYAPLTSDKARYVLILKLNRLLKIYRFFSFFDKLKTKRLLGSINVSFIKFAAVVALFIYWSAMVLYMATCFYESCTYNGWYIRKLKDSTEARVLTSSANGRFVLSLIYSFSVSLSIGIGNILPKNQYDLLFVVVGVVLGKLIVGYFVAELMSLMILRRRPCTTFHEYLSAVQFHVKKRSIPEKLEKRIHNYFKIQWQRDEAHSLLTGKSLTVDLPRLLKDEVRAEECLPTMNKFIIFDDLGAEFIQYLMKDSKVITLGPSEIVSYFGSINREMYIICRGYCLQQTESNIYRTIGPGTAVGFSSLLFGLPSMNNTYTATHCVLVYINVTTFNNALRHSASLYKIVYKARQRVLAKYNANYEVRMIENPHYTKMRVDFKLKYRKFNEKWVTRKSFINTYKYCMYNKESYGKLSNGPGRICLLKYLLMPIAILPNGPFFKFWLTVRLINTLVTCLLIPLEYALSPHMHQLHYLLLMTDIIAYLDMYIRMHLSYYGPENQLVIHPWTTAEHYIKGPFIFDLLIWFPYTGLVQAVARGHNEGHSEFSHTLSPHFLHCSVHLVKMLDFYRILSATAHLSKEFQMNHIFHCCKYVFYSLFIIHIWSVITLINTCEYKHISELPEELTKANITVLPGKIPLKKREYNYYCAENVWLNKTSYRNYNNVWEVYFVTVYWVTQYMTGIVFGAAFDLTRKETLFLICYIVTGVIFYVYVLADIVSRRVRNYTRLLAYEEKFLLLLNFLESEKVNVAVVYKVVDHIQYYWRRTRGYQIHELISTMNCTLHEDTMLYLYEGTLRHVPLFENLDHAFFRVFGKELREEYFMEGDIVLSGNDVVRDIYIIHKGAVEISGQHNMVPVIMGIGGIFGNVFDKNVSLCGIVVRALKHLDVLCLNVETFRRILKDYPVIQKKLGAFSTSVAQRHYAIPSSFVDEGNIYVNPNLFWTARNSTSVNSKNTLLTFCKHSVSYQSLVFNAFTMFVLATAYYNCIITTYQFSFQHFSVYLLVTTVLIDIIFLLKFCLEINYPYSPGANPNACFWNKWSKTLDFFANLPFSYSVLFIPFVSDVSAHFYFSILRLITLLRMMYIFQFFSYYRRKLMYNRSLLELCNLLVFSTLTIHLLTCVWYITVCPFRKCGDEDFMPSINKNQSQELYAASLYLTLDILTGTGTGDIAPRTQWQVLTVVMFMIVAKIFLGYFIAQLVDVLESNNLGLVKFEAMVHEIRNYYVNAGIKAKKTKYVCDYLRLLWKRKRGIQDYEILSTLPRTIQMELMESLYGTLLKDSYIFCQTDRDFLRQLSLFLRHRTFFPGNYIVRDGDVDNTMYFIHRGDVEILTVNASSKETVHEVLHKSEVFGIVQGLFKEIPHHFSFRALSIVDLAVLRLTDWEFLLDFFPRSKDVIYQRVEEIYYTI